MIKNLGTFDRGLRIVFGLFVVLLIVIGAVQGIAAIILGVFAAVFILTSSLGTCPLYIPFKINTNKKLKEE